MFLFFLAKTPLKKRKKIKICNIPSFNAKTRLRIDEKAGVVCLRNKGLDLNKKINKKFKEEPYKRRQRIVLCAVCRIILKQYFERRT